MNHLVLQRALSLGLLERDRERFFSIVSLHYRELLLGIGARESVALDKAVNLLVGKYLRLYQFFTQVREEDSSLMLRLGTDLFLGIERMPIYQEFNRIISLLMIKYQKDKTTDFAGFVHDIPPSSSLMVQLSKDVSEIYYGGKLNVSIGGQVKLHPPMIHDMNSTNWHYDGDPRFKKIILYLSSASDGQFSYNRCKNPWEQLLYSPLNCITIEEFRSTGLSLSTNSNAPFADLFQILPSEIHEVEVPLVAGQSVIFHGSSVLHKGGNNKLDFRPVFQGLISFGSR